MNSPECPLFGRLEHYIGVAENDLTWPVMSPEPNQRRFVTTRWSLVLATRQPGSPEAASALQTLCETYWFPVYGLFAAAVNRPTTRET